MPLGVSPDFARSQAVGDTPRGHVPARGSSALYPRRRRDKPQPFQRPAEKAASPTRQHSNLPHNQSRHHHGEGSWYRPKQAMGMEPSGAEPARRADRCGRRGSEGPKVRRGRWRDRWVDGAGRFKPACSRISRSRRRPLPGDLILPARGGTSTGMKQALSRRPLRRTVPRSGRAKPKRKHKTHGLRAKPGPLRASPSAQRLSA